VAVAAVEEAIEEVTHVTATPTADRSNGAPIESPQAWPPQQTVAAEQTSAAPEAPAAKPARKMATGGARKSVGGQTTCRQTKSARRQKSETQGRQKRDGQDQDGQEEDRPIDEGEESEKTAG
jgi:hypothetical protein